MRILAGIGILAIVIAVGVAVFFFGGYFNVAASEPNLGVVNWALVRLRMASVDRRSDLTIPVDLNSSEVVRAGARAFSERGCVNCHGAPGVKWQKFSEGLNPDPPDLKEIAHEREPSQLFWVVKHGIKMTGMPSFGAIGADDAEIWSIVAFVRKLPSTSETDFKSWIANP
jgi:mono/diheme cytochrome c family protein